MSPEGTRSGEDALKFKARDHVRALFVLKGIIGFGIIGFDAVGQNNGAHMDFQFFPLVVVINGIRRAHLFAYAAFALGQFDAETIVNGVLQGNGLRVFHINGFPLAKPSIVGVGNLLGAFFRTGPACNAFVHVHITRITGDVDPEITFLARNLFDLGKGQQFDIDMTPHFHQFGGENAHGTIVGGESLVQLTHDTADGSRFFHQINIIAGIGQIQCRLHSGNTPTHDHDGTDFRVAHSFLLRSQRCYDNDIAGRHRRQGTNPYRLCHELFSWKLKN